jgi:crossover junction endodeoxyribonuclease RuvC
MKTILGIDPGYGRVGWGVIVGEKSIWRHVAHGCIETSPAQPLPQRLMSISEGLYGIIDQYTPDFAAVEQLFFHKNVTTAIDVAQARGVILLALHERRIRIEEVTPLQVKSAVVGHGTATKKQVQHLTRLLLQMDGTLVQDDAADALAAACAVTHRASL